ncbi:MAG: FHA domain-containing protein [Candidatus Geothermincolales bacterium]
MPEIVVLILRYLFLALLYLFVALVVMAVLREIYGGRAFSAGAVVAGGRKGPRLVVSAGSGKGRKVSHPVQGGVVIGRAPDCDVVLEDEFVSNYHAKIYLLGGRFYVEDMGSTNGTFVNGRRITSPLELRGGDVIQVGRTSMEFKR